MTRNESRYHSEVRKEAVQQAIAAMKNKPNRPVLLMPSKRSSNLPNRNKDQLSKYNFKSSRHQSQPQRALLRGNQNSSHHSSGHGTAGDSEEYESTDDDYDDDEDDDLIDLNERTSSSDTPDLNVQNRLNNLKLGHQQHKSIRHSSSEAEQEVCSSSSSANERHLISSSKNSSSAFKNKQQQPLPEPPRVLGAKESANKYLNRYEHTKNVNHHHKSTSNQQQAQLFQLKEQHSGHTKHHSKTSSKNLILNEDKPPALPQHQTSAKLNYNQQNLDDDRPPERTPKRVHSKQQSSNLITEQSLNETSTQPADLISFEHPVSINSFNSEQRNNNNTMMSSGSNNSSNNHTSLSTGAIDEPFSNLNNQNCNSIDNLPPEYDQVYGDHSSTATHTVQQDSHGNRSPSNRSRISNDTSYSTGTSRYKVSAKIQQLLNTLKRPKKRPLDDFYKDDDFDQQLLVDPNAPKPEGSTMTPIIGEQLEVPSGLPKTLEAALQRYGSATFKAPAVTVLDINNKISAALTYGKLLSRSKKIAYNLLNKVGQKRSNLSSSEMMPLKAGNRVALVFPNNDPGIFFN